MQSQEAAWAVSEMSHRDRTAEFELLYLRHRDSVYRLAIRYGGGRKAWAEDVLQDVFVKLFREIDTLEELGELKKWLYRVTATTSIDRLRRDRAVEALTLRWMFERSPPPPTPESLMTEKDLLVRAAELIDRLPPKERVAFCMYYLDGMQMPEIGEIIGHTKGYVSKLIAHAEARMEKWRQTWR